MPRISRRVVLLAASIVPLAGCGFRPLYLPKSPEDRDRNLAAISITRIPNRPGQILEAALRENLNPNGVSVPARWRLETVLTIQRSDLGIQRNATATTSELVINVAYSLYEKQSDKLLYSGVSRAVGGFDLLLDAYATQVASDGARDRALRQVADDMSTRLELFLREQERAAAR